MQELQPKLERQDLVIRQSCCGTRMRAELFLLHSPSHSSSCYPEGSLFPKVFLDASTPVLWDVCLFPETLTENSPTKCFRWAQPAPTRCQGHGKQHRSRCSAVPRSRAALASEQGNHKPHVCLWDFQGIPQRPAVCSQVRRGCCESCPCFTCFSQDSCQN